LNLQSQDSYPKEKEEEVEVLDAVLNFKPEAPWDGEISFLLS
jgi:hypothetical protein